MKKHAGLKRTPQHLLPKPWSKQINKCSHFVAVMHKYAPLAKAS